MKARFEDLMYQAGLTAQGCWDEMDGYDHEAIEKFAELIVQECTGVMFQMWFDSEIEASAVADVRKKIRNHFGIEE